MKYLLFAVIFLGGNLLAQTGGLQGTVKNDRDASGIATVIVRVDGTDISGKTTDGGFFSLSHIPAGNHYIIFQKKDFYSLIIPDVKIAADKITRLNVKMFPGNEAEYLFLEIGGIQVTAQRELLPEESETVQRISSGEIEHMQANSLSDVLDLIPGNEKSVHPGLGRKQQIALRNLDDQSAMFGTKIIVDDVPLTNNADLQTGVGVNYGTSVQTTAEGQYDLREVVADNLEKVEVQAGASSVEYGDHTAGVIVAQTKTRNVPTRIKIKHNPDTQEANWMGGFRAFGSDLVYNFNYGYSERKIRVTGDEYHRISGSLKANTTYWDEKLNLSQRLSYSRKLEEDNDASDPYGIKAYNRDHHLTYSHRIKYNYNAVAGLYWRNYVDYKRRNSWKHKRESADLGFQTNRLINGTQEGIPIEPSYFSDVRTIGDEWSYGSKLKWNQKIFTGPVLHRLLVGGEFQRDENNGPGKTYDILKPPGGKANSRPRSFDDIPGITQMALFMEDRVTGEWLMPFTINAGFRIDSYNPTGFSFGNLFSGKDAFKAKQGTFFNPRVGLKLKLFSRTQLRFSYGKSSKTPALSMLYPEQYYLDSFGYTLVSVPDGNGGFKDSTVSLITTTIYDRSNPDLKGYQSSKYEASLDQQIGSVGLTLTAYYRTTNGGPKTISRALSYDRYFWPNWPDTSGRQTIETVLLANSPYKLTKNLRKSETSGAEITLRTHRIRSLNMRFTVNASFIYSKYSSAWYPASAGHPYRFAAGDTLSSGWVVPEDMEIIPYYKPLSSWRQRGVINYSADYISKPLGIWFTFKAQQVVWDQNLRIDHPDKSAQGYYKDGQNIPISPETSEAMGLNRNFDPLDITVDKSRSASKWLFSIVVSKSLFKGAEISLFVDNIWNDPAYYVNRYGAYTSRNPEMFWGLAFSSKIDDWFR